jgi:hypothetical protein
MANRNPSDRNPEQGGRHDELGSERNREMERDEEERIREQREGNLGAERNRESENVQNREESGRSRRNDPNRLPE